MLCVKRNFAPPLEQMSLKRKSLPLKLGRAGLTPLRLTGDGEARMGVGGKIIWWGAKSIARCAAEYTAYAPVREVLIEGNGAMKHVGHRDNHADIPDTDILIEGSGAIKHAVHSGNAADIPATETLIEGSDAFKHVARMDNATDIPAADILIKASLALK